VSERQMRLEDRGFERRYRGSLPGAGFRADYICALCAAPYLNICGGIAYIIEASRGKLPSKERSFVRSLKIQLAIASVHFVEQAEIGSDSFGQFAIGGRSECYPASRSFFAVNEVEDLRTVRKTGWIEMDTSGELTFDESAARKQPQRDQQKRQRAGLERGQGALPQDIAPDQCAVEINAQNRRRRLGRFRSCY